MLEVVEVAKKFDETYFDKLKCSLVKVVVVVLFGWRATKSFIQIFDRLLLKIGKNTSTNITTTIKMHKYEVLYHSTSKAKDIATIQHTISTLAPLILQPKEVS